jgi:hypothetical protein
MVVVTLATGNPYQTIDDVLSAADEWDKGT